jgi:hypothetical protein
MARMADSQTIQWRRIAVESVAIVLSILLAFAIDAWWEERQERTAEAEILVGLKQEFQDTQALINDKLAQYGNMKTAVAQLLVAHEQKAWQYEAMTIDGAFQWLITPTSIEFGGGVLDAVISAGRLEIISDKTLRSKLAGWQAMMNEVRDDEVGNADYIINHVIPYIARTGVSTAQGARDKNSEWPTQTSSIADDVALINTLLNDAEFKALLDIRYAFILHAMQEYDAAYRAADDILMDISNDSHP